MTKHQTDPPPDRDLDKLLADATTDMSKRPLT
jgi:hypothetical protein